MACIGLEPLKTGRVGRGTGVPDKAAVIKASSNVGKIEGF